jgi:hypothetical protein
MLDEVAQEFLDREEKFELEAARRVRLPAERSDPGLDLRQAGQVGIERERGGQTVISNPSYAAVICRA